MSGIAEARATKIREVLPKIFSENHFFYVECSEREIAVWVDESLRTIELKSAFEKEEVFVNAPWRLAASNGRRLREDSWIIFNPTKIEECIRELFSKE